MPPRRRIGWGNLLVSSLVEKELRIGYIPCWVVPFFASFVEKEGVGEEKDWVGRLRGLGREGVVRSTLPQCLI